MNLILAGVWFALGAGVLIWEFNTGNRIRLHVLGDISPGWLAFPMGLYNLARWYAARAYRRDMQAVRELQAHRSHHRYHEHEPERPIDPNFDFTSGPSQEPTRSDAPPPSSNITDQPPTTN